jgi:hypothetical protein
MSVAASKAERPRLFRVRSGGWRNCPTLGWWEIPNRAFIRHSSPAFWLKSAIGTLLE